MIDIPIDSSSVMSLFGSVDLHWKSQLLVDYSKELHTSMMLDDQLHEEGYLVHEGVIYHHDRKFLLEPPISRRGCYKGPSKSFVSALPIL